jgi:polygalacturonase
MDGGKREGKLMRANIVVMRPSVFIGLLLGTGCGHEAASGVAASGPTSPSGVSSQPRGYTEPKIPPACAMLSATKTAVNGTLSEADESTLDTERIQAAINACPKGQAVKLQAEGGKDGFLSGPLTMKTGTSLWIDANATLFASRNPRDFDVDLGACGTDEMDDSGGCRALINVTSVDDVGIVGEGTIDGRGGEPMIGGTATWWDVAQDAKKKNLKHSNPRLIDVRKSKNFTLYKLHIYNSPKFHVVINAQGFVVWGITMITPSRPTNSVGLPLTSHYARNTDGVDPSGAIEGVIAYNYISVGDDQIAIKGGNGGPTTDLTIAHNRFGTGHGMSIGSETNGGVSNILVYDLSIDGAMPTGGMPKGDHNGIRIKSDSSRGGLVTNISYRDVCIRDMVNPILISPYYSRATGTMIPDFKKIVLENVRAIRSDGSPILPSVVTLTGYDEDHILDVTLNNVVVEGLDQSRVKAAFVDAKLGPGPVSIPIVGKGVKVSNAVTQALPPNPCTGKFATAPGGDARPRVVSRP